MRTFFGDLQGDKWSVDALNVSTRTEDVDEFSVFASLVYGFGDVQRPSRVGGY